MRITYGLFRHYLTVIREFIGNLKGLYWDFVGILFPSSVEDNPKP